VTRVPETITEAKELTQKSNQLIHWIEYGNGYKYSSFNYNYGGLDQRWLLVYSEQSKIKEMATFEKKLNKIEDALKNKVNAFEKRVFNCQEDALKELEIINKKEHYFIIDGVVNPIESYDSPGRPKKGAEKKITGYSMRCLITRHVDAINFEVNSKGKFILATNDLDEHDYSNATLLRDYKDQHNEERGFKFLKDPWFMLDSIFLKDETRITGLMMVMSLCLFVYNFAQYKIRERLNSTNETLPNQLNKQVKNPTLRWLFQIMEGISVVKIFDADSEHIQREAITNLNEIRIKIIRLCGKTACEIYRISPS
jgi:transposase